MNIYSKGYNIYTSSQLRGVSEKKLANPFIIEFMWNMFVDTIKRIETWQQVH